MDDAYDIVIVGGGFAGLKAAEQCARRGSGSIVFERSSEIGFPIHTSGGSFIPDLRELGLPSNLYHPIETVEFVAPSESARFEYEPPKFCVMDVRGVRQHLAERAIDAGAAIRTDTTVTDTVGSSGTVSGVEVRGENELRTVRADVTIDASGFRSVVAQKAGLHDGFERFGRGLEYDIYAPDYDATTASLIVGEEIIPAGYGWIFPYREDRVRVGVGSLYPDEPVVLEACIDTLFERFAHLGIEKDAQVESHSGVIPSQDVPNSTVGEGVILAGDAANFPFGLVGEGIRMAMVTGELAGRTAASSVEAGDSSREFLQRYETEWKSRFGDSLDVSNSLNRRLADLEDEQWDEGTRILRELDSEEFYHILRCDFSKETITGILASHPEALLPLGKELVKNGVLRRIPF